VGRTVRGLLRFIEYLRFLTKFLEKKSFSGGQSVDLRRTV
jgi:hypothetical protein